MGERGKGEEGGGSVYVIVFMFVRIKPKDVFRAVVEIYNSRKSGENVSEGREEGR